MAECRSVSGRYGPAREQQRQAEADSRQVGSFVALGDSFTEGLDDPRADHEGYLGWADRFAGMLAAPRPGLRYANLAVRGKLLGEVAEEQVPRAIAMAPDLVSLAAGGNDLLRPRGDPDALAEQFDEAVRTLDPNVKMNPPLRSADDRVALIDGLRDGTIGSVATDHAPHARHEKDVPFETGIARYKEIARGQIIGDLDGMLKLIFHLKTRRLLGVWGIGTQATELVHIGQAVMALGGTLDYFVNNVFNYPTLAESYKVAALDAMNRLRAVERLAA